ncbi:MAG: helix-turn-helix transcriptional regulator [Pseudomonadota bacterium]
MLVNGDGLDERLALNWLNNERRAKCVVSIDLKLIWSNAEAIDLLRESSEAEIVNGRFNLRDQMHQEKLLDMLPLLGTGPLPIAVPCSDGNGHLIVNAETVSPHGSTTQYVGLTFRETGKLRTVAFAPLDSAFHLTRAEHAVLTHMLEGLTASKCASRIGSSIETVRSHIRSIYAKMDVNSREEMFAKIIRYSV